MKPPPRLQSLIEEGLIDSVVRQLMSGKEATHRSFRQAVNYTENRKVKNSRPRWTGLKAWSAPKSGA